MNQENNLTSNILTKSPDYFKGRRKCYYRLGLMCGEPDCDACPIYQQAERERIYLRDQGNNYAALDAAADSRRE